MAVSPAAIDESTFIWNPNLIALSSSIALAGAWRAWSTRRARWWILAFGGAIVTMHCHVLGVVLAPAIVGLWRSSTCDGAGRAAAADASRSRAGAAALLAASYVPLLAHELRVQRLGVRVRRSTTSRAAAAPAVSLPLRLVIVGLRVLAWPLTGLSPSARGRDPGRRAGRRGHRRSGRSPRPAERFAARWFGLTLRATVVALAVSPRPASRPSSPASRTTTTTRSPTRSCSSLVGLRRSRLAAAGVRIGRAGRPGRGALGRRGRRRHRDAR